jgi:hypothetical protein
MTPVQESCRNFKMELREYTQSPDREKGGIEGGMLLPVGWWG